MKRRLDEEEEGEDSRKKAMIAQDDDDAQEMQQHYETQGQQGLSAILCKDPAISDVRDLKSSEAVVRSLPVTEDDQSAIQASRMRLAR